jgi:glyoxylate utilization-related uncharacterized protein
VPNREETTVKQSRSVANGKIPVKLQFEIKTSVEEGDAFNVIAELPGTTKKDTETLDYVIVIEGEIDMDMDDSTVRLKAGDVMVQRATNHAWVNRGQEPARVAFVLLDSKPLGIGHPVVRGEKAS